MQSIKIHLLHPNAKLPSKAHADDACFDVVAVSRVVEKGYITYGLGLATEIPAGWEGKFYARSSVSNYDLVLCNGVGVIDSAYRGEWSARFKMMEVVEEYGPTNDRQPMNFPVRSPRIYEVGDRIGQIQFGRVPEVVLEQVEELAPSARGEGGFGSTGR